MQVAGRMRSCDWPNQLDHMTESNRLEMSLETVGTGGLGLIHQVRSKQRRQPEMEQINKKKSLYVLIHVLLYVQVCVTFQSLTVILATWQLLVKMYF